RVGSADVCAYLWNRLWRSVYIRGCNGDIAARLISGELPSGTTCDESQSGGGAPKRVSRRIAYRVTMQIKALLLALALPCLYAQPYDVVIRNAHVVDGTGSPW